MQANFGISFYFSNYSNLKRAAHTLDRALRTRSIARCILDRALGTPVNYMTELFIRKQYILIHRILFTKHRFCN